MALLSSQLYNLQLKRQGNLTFSDKRNLLIIFGPIFLILTDISLFMGYFLFEPIWSFLWTGSAEGTFWDCGMDCVD